MGRCIQQFARHVDNVVEDMMMCWAGLGCNTLVACVLVMQGLREKYERHHHVVYTPEALEAAVKLSHKYIADRFLPDKVR